MALTDAAYNAMLDELASVAVYMSLHDGAPSTNGANELTGGSYARKSVSWSSASSGDLSTSGAILFDIPALTSGLAYFGLWSASSSGTFYGFGNLSATESYTNAGTYNLTSATISGS